MVISAVWRRGIISPDCATSFGYFVPRRAAKYCDEYVCLFVCSLAYLENHTAKLHQIFVHVALSRVIRRRCDTLCTSGFADDVLFSHNGLYDVSCKFISGEIVTTKTTSSIPAKFCSTIKITKYTCRSLRTRGEVCYLRLSCHTQNRKYITYRNAVGGGLSHDNRQHA